MELGSSWLSQMPVVRCPSEFAEGANFSGRNFDLMRFDSILFDMRVGILPAATLAISASSNSFSRNASTVSGEPSERSEQRGARSGRSS